MPAIKYRVTLFEEEVEMLESLLRKGKSGARNQAPSKRECQIKSKLLHLRL